MPKTNDSSGLPNAMPLAPGNRKAGIPAPAHVVAAEGPKPPYLDPSRAKFTRERIAAMDKRMKSKAGSFEVGESQQQPIDGFQVL
jgi:hypothetical protein